MHISYDHIVYNNVLFCHPPINAGDTKSLLTKQAHRDITSGRRLWGGEGELMINKTDFRNEKIIHTFVLFFTSSAISSLLRGVPPCRSLISSWSGVGNEVGGMEPVTFSNPRRMESKKKKKNRWKKKKKLLPPAPRRISTSTPRPTKDIDFF